MVVSESTTSNLPTTKTIENRYNFVIGKVSNEIFGTPQHCGQTWRWKKPTTKHIISESSKFNQNKINTENVEDL